MNNSTFHSVMDRQVEIIKNAGGFDYEQFKYGRIGFDFEGLMKTTGYDLNEVKQIQLSKKVGNTPLLELENFNRIIKRISPSGYGARLFIKDESANATGSFKARRASLVVHVANTKGYPGVIAATSGNYGAAVASQAAMNGLKCIVLQEVFDSRHYGQPEILEKGRACEAYGAEVWQTTVGPELFYAHLLLLEQTGFFNASLYTPFSVLAIETLGYEIGRECLQRFGKAPDAVVITHAGGGNVTGTARGLLKAGCNSTRIIGASVDLHGLHMASDTDFNRKSFTTGHTGFGIPFLVNPDRTEVPKNAARPLRYLDRYVTITQGEVFYITEALSKVEGLERGPAGNTSLAAAFAIAREMREEDIIVVQETEYTGAGKHPTAQLTFARQMGIEVRRGKPSENVPGKRIVIPKNPSQIVAQDVDLDKLRQSYISTVLSKENVRPAELFESDIDYLVSETKTCKEWIYEYLDSKDGKLGDSGTNVSL